MYGEWLRRERRRLDARKQLRTAHEMLSEMGMEAFAHRAARELTASGEAARKRTAETSSALTAQEAQIARLVREGLSNPEIVARLSVIVIPRFGRTNRGGRSSHGWPDETGPARSGYHTRYRAAVA